MHPESANEQHSSDKHAVPFGVSYVQTGTVQTLLQILLETPGLHASHIPHAVNEGQEPLASLITQLDTSEGQAVQQHQDASRGGKIRAANIAEIHAQWQRNAKELWHAGTHSLKKIAAKLEKKYYNEYRDTTPDDKEEKKKYARSRHTIRKYIHSPE